MHLKELANIIYTEGTASENTQICIMTHADNRVLWRGNAKSLKEWEDINGWIVAEILIDRNDVNDEAVYNKNKIVTVI